MRAGRGWGEGGLRPSLTVAVSVHGSSVVSVVTLLLLPQAQGNIWLFEDSLLITGKPTGMSGTTHSTRTEGTWTQQQSSVCLVSQLKLIQPGQSQL